MKRPQDDLTRRQLLGWASAGLGATAAAQAEQRRRTSRRPRVSRAATSPPVERTVVPRVNGGVNIQPIRVLDPAEGTEPIIRPELIDLQLRAIYDAGFESVRLTLSWDGLRFDLLAAIPYVRAARALGIEVLGIIGQLGFGHDLSRLLADEETREPVLQLFVDLFAGEVLAAAGVESRGDVAFQIFNEPTNFLGLSAGEYVQFLLRPVSETLRQLTPETRLVCAAPVGLDVGIRRAAEMLEHGAENYCDSMAFHVYDTDTLDALSVLTRQPVWVTETGVAETAGHLPWVTDVVPLIRSRLDVERLFFFQLADFTPGGHRLIALEESGGAFSSRVESEALWMEYLERTLVGDGDQNLWVTYDELIPDITRYFPTEEEVDRVLDFDV